MWVRSLEYILKFPGLIHLINIERYVLLPEYHVSNGISREKLEIVSLMLRYAKGF